MPTRCLRVYCVYASLNQTFLGWPKMVKFMASCQCTFNFIWCCRESNVMPLENDRVFSTAGIYYRPNELKTMTCLLGNSEQRQVFRNFSLQNLNSNLCDPTHHLYEKYLQYNRFIPPGETMYFEHSANIMLPDPANPDAVTKRGACNIFPLSLQAEELNKSTSSALGRRFEHFK